MGCMSEIGLFRYFNAVLQFKCTKVGHTSITTRAQLS